MTATLASTTGQTSVATWLSSSLLVVCVQGAASDEARSVPLLAEHGGRRTVARARWQLVSAGDDTSEPTWLLTVIPVRSDDAPVGRLLLGVEGEPPLSRGTVEGALCDATELGQYIRRRAPASLRAQIVRFLACTPREHRLELDTGMAAGLAAIHQQLRETTSVAAATEPACGLDGVTALDQQTFLLTGWWVPAECHEVTLAVVSPEGVRADVQPAATVSTPDRGRGREQFRALVSLESPSVHPDGWTLQLNGPSGTVAEAEARGPVVTSAHAARHALREVLKGGCLGESVLEELVLPALEALARSAGAPRIDRVVEHGHAPSQPETSVVIAVDDVELVQLQLGELARDPHIGEMELILVAPEPSVGFLTDAAAELHQLYGVPFRLAALSDDASRCQSLNVGAAIARGINLVVLSGGAIPRSPGWLAALLDFKRRSPEIAAVAPKVIAADETILNAGIEYESTSSGGWKPHAICRGAPRAAAGARAARRVDGCSDGCLLVEAGDFDRAGGLCELYLDDGLGVADLCLALRGAGREVWYVPDAEFYLLDRARSALAERATANTFDTWLFNRRWASMLRSPPVRSLEPAPEAASERPIEHLEARTALARPGWIHGAAIVLPAGDASTSLYAGTYGFAVGGWVRSADGSTLSVEASAGGVVIARARADATIVELGPSAEGAGFQLVLGSLRLPPSFEVRIEAIHDDGRRASLGCVVGRRRRGATPRRAAIQPLIVTTLGRSGSNWILALLNQHPEVVVHRPFQYEAVLTRYWAEALCALSEPLSFMSAILPEVVGDDWWLGRSRQSLLPLAKPGPEMARWLGRENVDSLIGFVQGQVDAFYRELARVENKPRAKMFAEKSSPGSRSTLISDLYPGAREVVLVRDFRDRMNSILAYNAKRGLRLWGHDGTTSDEDWLAYLRSEAESLTFHWRSRRDQCLLVRYEDLIQSPERTLVDLFAYAGVEGGPARVARVLNRAARTMQHGQEFHRTASSPEESVGRWKREMSPERKAACAAVLDDLLVEFGYEPTGEAAATGPGAGIEPGPI